MMVTKNIFWLVYILLFLKIVYVKSLFKWKSDECYEFVPSHDGMVKLNGTFIERECVIACKNKFVFLYAGMTDDGKCSCHMTARTLLVQEIDDCVKRYDLDVNILKDVFLQSNVLVQSQDLVVVASFHPARSSEPNNSLISTSDVLVDGNVFENITIEMMQNRTNLYKLYILKNNIDAGYHNLCANFTDMSDFTISRCLNFNVIKKPFILEGEYLRIDDNKNALKNETRLNITIVSSNFSLHDIQVYPTARNVTKRIITSKKMEFYFPNDGLYDIEITGVNNGDRIKFFKREYFIVQKPFKKICLMNKRAISGKETLFKVNTTKGIQSLGLVFVWHFGMSQPLETTEPFINFTLHGTPKKDWVNVKIEVSNYVSCAVINTTVLLEEDLRKLKIIVPQSLVLQGQKVKFETNLRNRTSAILTWTIGQIRYDVKSFNRSFNSPGRKNIFVTAEIRELQTQNATATLDVIRRIAPFELHYKLLERYQVEIKAEFFIEEYNTSLYNLHYDWNFGDNSTYNNSTYTVFHQYPTFRKYTAKLNISNPLSFYQSSIDITLEEHPCNLQIFSPWKYRKKKEFLLKDEIQLFPVVIVEKCNNPKILYVWQIFDQRNNNKTVKTEKKPKLKIKAKDLGVSDFSFLFKVSLQSKTTKRTLMEREYKGYFKIFHSGIKIKFQDHEDKAYFRVINHNFSQKYLLNASQTYDIDEPYSNSNLSFNWTCFSNTKKSCFGNRSAKQAYFPDTKSSAVSIDTSLLTRTGSAKDIFLFKLEVSNYFKKIKDESLYYLIFDGEEKESIGIDCVSCNTNGQQPYDKIINLQINCPFCDGNTLTGLTWTVYRKQNKVSESLKSLYKKVCLPNIWGIFESAHWANDSTLPSPYEENKKELPREENNICRVYYPKKKFKNGYSIPENNLLTTTRTTLNTLSFPPPEENSYFYNNFGYRNKEKEKMAVKSSARTIFDDTEIFQSAKEETVNYFEIRKDFIPVFRENSFFYSNNKKELSINSSYPAENIMIEIRKEKYLLARKRLTFTNPTLEWKCINASRREGNGLDYEFQIKCLTYKNKDPMMYTLERYDEIEKKYYVILVSNEHYMNFVLAHLRFEEVKVRVILQNKDGERISLCPLNFTVVAEKSDVSSNISLKLKSQKVIDEKSLNYFITALHKYKNIDGSKELYLKACEYIGSVDVHMYPLMTSCVLSSLVEKSHEMNSSCVARIFKLLQSYTSLSPSSSPRYVVALRSDSFANNLFRVISRLYDFYKRNKFWEKSKDLMKIASSLHKVVLHKNKINDYYAEFKHSDVMVMGKKHILNADDVKFSNNLQIGVPSFNELKNQCLDIGFNMFKGSSILTYVNVLFEKCWKQQSLVLPSEYLVKFPFVKTIIPVYRLNWRERNHHYFHSPTIGKHEFYFHIRILNMSENSPYFNFTFALKRGKRKEVLVKKIYNKWNGDSENLDIIYSATFHEIMKLDFEVSMETINPVYRKEIDKSWFVYSFGVREVSCESNEESNDKNVCTTSHKSRINQLICKCNGSGIISAKFIDIKNTHVVDMVDPRENQSLVILYVLIIVACIAVLWLTFLTYKTNDFQSTCYLDLPENLPCDNFEYHMIIETGCVSNAGTSSRICAILYGTNGHSEKMELTFQSKPMFERCVKACVAIRCPHHLGKLLYLKLWHDAKGENREWYLKQVVVRDKSSKSVYYFPVFNWLSFARGLKSTNVTIESSEFPPLWNVQNICEWFLDFHDWLSILFGHIKPRYTRAERLLVISATILYLFMGFQFFKRKPFMEEDIYLIGLLHIQSWEMVYTAIFLMSVSVPFRLMFGFIFRHAASSKSESSFMNKRKVGDAFYLERTFSSPYTGALLQYHTHENEALSGMSSKNKNEHLKCHQPKFSYSKRVFARLVLVAFILVAIAFDGYLATKYSYDIALKVSQIIVMAIIFDIVILSNFLSLPLAVVSEKWFPTYYSDMFAQFSQYLSNERASKSNGLEEHSSNKKMYMRNRARFIRYAEPYNKEEMKKKRRKNSKEKIFRKCLREIWLTLVLLVIALILYENEVKNVIKPRQSSSNQIFNREPKSNEASMSQPHTNTVFNRQSFNSQYSNSVAYNSQAFNVQNANSFTDKSQHFNSRTLNSLNLRSTLKNEVLPFLNASNCNQLYLLDNYVFTRDAMLINPVYISLKFAHGKKDMYFKCHRYQDSNPSMLKEIENEILNQSASSVTINFVLASKYDGMPKYRSREIIFEKVQKGIYEKRDITNEIFFENLCMQYTRTMFVFFVKVVLFLLLCIQMYTGFSRLLQYGLRGFTKPKRIINTFIGLLSAALLVNCLVHCIVGNLLQTALSDAKYNTKSLSNHVFYYVNFMYSTTQGLQMIIATLYFLVMLRLMLLLKYHPRTFILIEVMSNAIPDLISYMVFFCLALFTFSSFWYCLLMHSSTKIMMFSGIIEYVGVRVPRFTLHEITEDISTLSMIVSIFCSISIYLLVRTSFIFFVGRKAYLKIRKKKSASFSWIVKTMKNVTMKNWAKLLEFKKQSNIRKSILAKLKNFHKKENAELSKMRRKYLLNEIDYQSEELLYRVNKLAQLEDDYDLQILQLFFKCNKNVSSDIRGAMAVHEDSLVNIPSPSRTSESSSVMSVDSSSCDGEPVHSIINVRPYDEYLHKRRRVSFDAENLLANSQQLRNQRITKLSLTSSNSALTSPVCSQYLPFDQPRNVEMQDLSRPFSRPNLNTFEQTIDDDYTEIREKIEQLKRAEKNVRPEMVPDIENKIYDSGHSDSGFGSFDAKRKSVNLVQSSQEKNGNSEIESSIQDDQQSRRSSVPFEKRQIIFPKIPEHFADRQNERRDLFNNLLEKILSRKNSYLQEYLIEENDFEEDSYV